MNGVHDERRHREDGLLDDEEEKRSVVLVQHRVVELDAGRVEDRAVVEAAIRNALRVSETPSALPARTPSAPPPRRRTP